MSLTPLIKHAAQCRLTTTAGGVLIDGGGDYWFLDNDLTLNEITKTAWLQRYFGGDAARVHRIRSALPYSPEFYQLCHDENDAVFACFYQENRLYHFDAAGHLVAHHDLMTFIGGDSVYDVAYHAAEVLWLVLPTASRVMKVNLSTQNIIAELPPEHLNYPESIHLDVHRIYVSNMGNCRVDTFDKNTLKHHDSQIFPHRIWQYLPYRDGAIISTDKGVFYCAN